MEHDIVMLQAKIMDSILIGDAIATNTPNVPITAKLATDNKELETKKTILLKDIDKMRKIMDRSNRDFTDVKDSLPETPQKQFLHFIEDYTLAFLVMGYLFMVIGILYLYSNKPYSMTPGFSFKALLQGIAAASIITCIMYVLLYYFS